MRALLFTLLCLASGIATATPVAIGGEQFRIPAPHGFFEGSPGDSEIHTLMVTFVPDTNVLHAWYLPRGQERATRDGRSVDLSRRAFVQSVKSLDEETITGSFFQLLKDRSRTRMRDAYERNRELVEAVSQEKWEALFPQDQGRFRVRTQALVLPLHDESEHSFAHSMIHLSAPDDAEAVQFSPTTKSLTITFVHLGGKVLLLYVVGDADDLDWTRSVAKAWSDGVLRANPSGAPPRR